MQPYAPKENDMEEERNRFYTSLKEQFERVPRHDIFLVNCDLNAKVGADNEG